MTDKPDVTDLLEPSQEEEDRYLVVAEGEAPPELGPVTLTQVVDSLNARRYHEAKQAELNAQADALIAPLQARIDQIKAWRDEQVADRERRIAFHDSRCIAYARFNPPAKGKTVKLPGGQVSEKDQPAEWTYTDEKTVLAVLVCYRTDLVRVKEEPDKVGLKKAATVIDDKVYITDAVGEMHELPITVTERPAKFTVKVD